MPSVREKAEGARRASRLLLGADDEARSAAVLAMAARLEEHASGLVAANGRDVAAAEKSGLAPALLDRLHLDAAKLATVVDGCRQVAGLPDPVGQTRRSTVLDDGLHLYQVTCPLGVVACIFESRPDVVVQISALAVRSGNAVLLKGGSEAGASNTALAEAVRAGLEDAGLPADAVQLLDGREEVDALLKLDGLVDLVVPRGSSSLVRHIMDNTRIPVLGHAEGVCHVYVDAAADLEKAMHIVLDAKLDYPAACNAVETVLVHQGLRDWVPDLVEELIGKGVQVHQGGAADFDREYGAAELGIGLVDDVEAAMAHIARYGSGHTDAIVTEDPATAAAFVRGVDSAGVFVNASTRFADGYRYGLGAEVGVSTAKIHARGPVGLEGLVSSRWILVGEGHLAGTYRERPFRHEPSRSTLDEQLEAWDHA